ncbi:MAG: RNA polymerase II transcription factor B subunit 4 [Bathelium mastoideum]|nr:MAG: RNA polymerase II transcription factor B subunit 4 [Bathelium mastoideum]
MNAIDGTDRLEASAEGPPPALLVIVLDTNPYAWAILRETISLLDAVSNILVFINAHLAFNNSNMVAVIASHTDRATWLYPTPFGSQENIPNGSTSGQEGDQPTSNGNTTQNSNKYKPFAEVEQELMANLRSLMSTTDPAALESTTNTMIAGALSSALAYISKTAEAHNATRSTDPNPSYAYDAPTTADPNDPNSALLGLQSRILVLSVSTSLAEQYIPLMNAIFAAQRLRVPIDVLSLTPSSTTTTSTGSSSSTNGTTTTTTAPSAFLQQAADATAGVFYAARPPRRPGAQLLTLLPTLLTLFLPDQTARRALLMPSASASSSSSDSNGGSSGGSTAINFQAACFCHRRTVTVGYVCSICLSIFCGECGVVTEGLCWTCGTRLRLGRYGREPKVVPAEKGAGAGGARRKKKRGDGQAGSGVATPRGGEGMG